ncbi:MAG: DUF423 domain-containing protein [Pseudomonadota bacterium]
MRRNLILAASAGFGVVCLGAFGAHALDDRLTGPALGWWETATLYGLVHAAAALSVSLFLLAARPASGPQEGDVKSLPGAGVAPGLFLIGIVFFSGSLYAMALGAPRWFGAITPLGGVSFLAGWASLAIAGFRSRPPR